jgi:hypothetical protein
MDRRRRGSVACLGDRATRSDALPAEDHRRVPGSARLFGRIVAAHQDPDIRLSGKDGPGQRNGAQQQDLSKGLTRSRTDNHVVMRSTAEPATEASGQGNVTAIASHGPPAAAMPSKARPR